MSMSWKSSVRHNVNVSSMYLAFIFSWLTPWSWWVDAMIIVLLELISMRVTESAARQEPT